MADGYLSEIRTFSFAFAPRNWAQCNGQLLPINQNQALFSLLGVTYGGNGQTTFALPDLRGKTPMHAGTAPSGGPNYTLGQSGGEANHTLLVAEIPGHAHQAYASSNGPAANTPSNNFWASNTGSQPYGSVSGTAMAANALGNTGGGQGHNNMPPYLVLNQCICIAGIFPTRS